MPRTIWQSLRLFFRLPDRLPFRLAIEMVLVIEFIFLLLIYALNLLYIGTPIKMIYRLIYTKVLIILSHTRKVEGYDNDYFFILKITITITISIANNFD